MKKSITLLLSFAIIFNTNAQKNIDDSFFKKYFLSEYIFYLAMIKYNHVFEKEDSGISDTQNSKVKYLQHEDIIKIEDAINKNNEWSYIQDKRTSHNHEGIKKEIIDNNLSFKSEPTNYEELIPIVESCKVSLKLPVLKANNQVLDVKSPFSYGDDIELEPNKYSHINGITRMFIQNPNFNNNNEEPLMIEGNKTVNFSKQFSLIDEINQGEFQIPFKIDYPVKTGESKITLNSVGEEIQIDKHNFKIKEIRNNQIVFLEPSSEIKTDEFKKFLSISTVNISGDSKRENNAIIVVIADKISLDFLDTTIDEDELLKANENHFQKINPEQSRPIGIAIFMKNKFDDHIKIENGISKTYEFKITSPTLTLTK